MRSGSLSISTRRALFGVAVTALLYGASGGRAVLAAGQEAGQAPAGQAPAGQQPPAPAGQQPPAGQAPAEDQLKFKTDAGVIIFQVKPDKTADFESAWTEIKTKLSASDKPDWKELGDSMQIYKSPATGQSVIYVFELNPASKTLSYDPSKILYATGSAWERPAADALYNKILNSLDGINTIPLQKVGGGGMGMGM